MQEKFEKWLSDNSITEVECLVADLGGIARGTILTTNIFIQGLENDSHRLHNQFLSKQFREVMLLKMKNYLMMFIILQILM